MNDFSFVSLFPYVAQGIVLGLGIGSFVWFLSYGISRTFTYFKSLINM